MSLSEKTSLRLALSVQGRLLQLLDRVSVYEKVSTNSVVPLSSNLAITDFQLDQWLKEMEFCLGVLHISIYCF